MPFQILTPSESKTELFEVNDVIRLSVVQEAAGGTVDDDEDALLTMIRKPPK
jgi:hypothetical protein